MDILANSVLVPLVILVTGNDGDKALSATLDYMLHQISKVAAATTAATATAVPIPTAATTTTSTTYHY